MSFSFGTPGTPANASNNFSFGNKSGGLFGTPSTSAPAFGAATPAFGSTAPSFGAASGTPAFGSTTATPAFGTGLSTSTTSAAPAFGLGTNTFGTGSTLGTGGGLNFGGTSTGTTATSTAAGSLGGLGGFSFGATTTSASTGLNFGTSTSAAPTGLFAPKMFPLSSIPERIPQIPLTQTFQMPASPVPYYQSSIAHQNPSILRDQANLSNQRQDYKLMIPSRDTYKVLMPSVGLSSSTVSGTQATSTVTPSLGLGGTAPAGITSASANGKGSDQPKQTKLPNEITTTVDSFKEFVKKQKGLSSEVMRFSVKPLHKVSKEAEERLGSVARLSSEVARGRVHAGKLRQQAASALAAAELAAREPIGCEADGSGPPGYVAALLGEMEAQAAAYRARLDALHAQLNAPADHTHLTHQEMSVGMRRMHEALVAVAGRLGAAHAQLQALHELYRRHARDKRESGAGAEGGAAKQSRSEQSLGGVGGAVLAEPRAALSSSMSAAAGPTPFSYLGTTLSPFSQNCTGGSWQPAAPQMGAAAAVATGNSGNLGGTLGGNLSAGGLQLQLQRPPGKRNKQ